MNKSVLLFAVFAASFVGVTAASSTKDLGFKTATVPSDRVGIPPLQVTVNVPPSMRPWVSDEIAEALACRVINALHKHGYTLGIRYLDSFSAPSSDLPLLAINLFEWRTDHVGNVNCTFAAVFSTPAEKKNLGLFTGTSVTMVSPHDWFARSDQFDDAAHQAINDLCKHISKEKLPF